MNQRITTEALQVLAEEDRARLVLWKQRYLLRADGFTDAQARRLCFCRWLCQQGRLHEGDGS